MTEHPADNVLYLVQLRASAIEQTKKDTYTWMAPSHGLNLLDLIDKLETGYNALVEERDRFRDRLAERNREYDDLAAKTAALVEALRYGAGAAINDLTAQNLPQEWSPRSGIGVMLAALGCKSTRLDDEACATLKAAGEK